MFATSNDNPLYLTSFVAKGNLNCLAGLYDQNLSIDSNTNSITVGKNKRSGFFTVVDNSLRSSLLINIPTSYNIKMSVDTVAWVGFQDQHNDGYNLIAYNLLSGNKLQQLNIDIEDPVLAAHGSDLYLLDKNQNRILKVSLSGENIWTKEIAFEVSDFAINQNGIYLVGNDSFASILIEQLDLNSNHLDTFDIKEVKGFAHSIALSNNGLIAIGGITDHDQAFAYIHHNETPIIKSYLSQRKVNVSFNSDNELLLFTAPKVYKFNPSTSELLNSTTVHPSRNAILSGGHLSGTFKDKLQFGEYKIKGNKTSNIYLLTDIFNP